MAIIIFRAMLVTERLAQRLRLKKQRVLVAISGISGASIAQYAVQVNVASRNGRTLVLHVRACFKVAQQTSENK